MACAPFETIETILPYLDLYLMDIKHTNPAKHKEFTGRPNDLMMENARKVALSGKCKLIIRVPVIPTFNDTIEEIQGIARFADTLPGVEDWWMIEKQQKQHFFTTKTTRNNDKFLTISFIGSKISLEIK